MLPAKTNHHVLPPNTTQPANVCCCHLRTSRNQSQQQGLSPLNCHTSTNTLAAFLPRYQPKPITLPLEPSPSTTEHRIPQEITESTSTNTLVAFLPHYQPKPKPITLPLEPSPSTTEHRIPRKITESTSTNTLAAFLPHYQPKPNTTTRTFTIYQRTPRTPYLPRTET